MGLLNSPLGLAAYILGAWVCPVAAATQAPFREVHRIGEARNPGPSGDFFISSSNPSGLRSKEGLTSDFGFGVHCFSETQLSAVSLPVCKQQFRSLARGSGRSARVLSGSPAPLRVNSQWAGSWTGVLQVSDVPCRDYSVEWPAGLYETDRVMIARHHYGCTSLLIATAYGYPRGPTWPDSQSRTDLLLGALTREVVLGARGFRIICGDFNHESSTLQQCQLWRAHGWIEVQDLAQTRWGIPPKPTCKNATRHDYIWLSPEAAALFATIHVTDVFQEHST